MKARFVVGGALALAGFVASVAWSAAPSAYTRPGHTERIALGSVVAGGCVSVGAASSDISADGRYVAVVTQDTMGDHSDTNQACDVYVIDRGTGRARRASIGSDGSQAIGDSYVPTLSADGRWVAFLSKAANLTPGLSTCVGCEQVYAHDMFTSRTIRVSVSTAGAIGNADSTWPQISTDGRFVSFESGASNLVPGDTNNNLDIFVRDLGKGTTTRANVSTGGQQANNDSFNPSISKGGRYVTFSSRATNLTANRGACGSEACVPDGVYVRDMVGKTTSLVSVNSQNEAAAYSTLPTCVISNPAPVSLPDTPASTLVNSLLSQRLSLCRSVTWPGARSISDDGRFVVFFSNATNLVPNDSNDNPGGAGGDDVFVRDLRTGRTERVSVTSTGGERVWSDGGTISRDGRHVMYMERETCGATPWPLSGESPLGSCLRYELYGYDRLTGAVDYISGNPAGKYGMAGSGCGTDPVQALAGDTFNYLDAMSADGRYATFHSPAQDLVVGDTNNACDEFVRDRGHALGAGGMVGTQPPSSAPPGCGLPVCPPLPAGAALQQSRVIPRPGLQDLFIRLDVSRMAPVAGAPLGGLLYELRFASCGQHYAVRAQRVPGADFDPAGGASFGLFRETPTGVWTHVAPLKGGYGTIGDSVVTAVPLSLLGGQAQLTDVTAYTAIGSYLSGPTKVLDSLRLSR